MSVATFLHAVETLLKAGNATEHSYRPALTQLFNTVLAPAVATNEPRHAAYGAPDFVIARGVTPLGHIEVKDVGVNLATVIADSERTTPTTPNGKQLKRYRAALPNLLYTDGLVWHWFVGGQLRLTAPLVIAQWSAQSQRLTATPHAATELTTLLQQFVAHNALTVTTPRALAAQLAQLARWLDEVIRSVFEGEQAVGNLHQQLEAFKKTLLPEITIAEFADMYAQTLVYGLFAARVAQPAGATFTRFDAERLIPKTNPFLRRLFQEVGGDDLDNRVAWLVDDCANLLAHTDMAAVLADFGAATQQQDPVVHFYETFLAAYDPKLRESRGVYYTPEPVVGYIVRSVDALLRTRFAKADGLADERTIVLDPATGTATFLHAVIQQIHANLSAAGTAGLWNTYVPQHLLTRVFGFELLMAPYAVAHFKLGLLLGDLGYQFGSNERLGVFLTNSLADLPSAQLTLPFAQFIADEGNKANKVKQQDKVMVVLGNPPYSGHSVNISDWIVGLVKHGDGTAGSSYYEVDGQPLGERNSKWLQDDYVKFIRFGQWRIHQTGEGLLAFITNNGYLDNPTFRGMRQSLLREFDTIYILNLHGNSKKRERAPDGGPDENVFDIQQGVAIAIFVKDGRGAAEHATVYYADLWGQRAAKYAALAAVDVTTTVWQELQPTSPTYLLVPQETSILGEYEANHALDVLAPINTVGIVTGQDAQVIGFTEAATLDLATQHNLLPKTVADFLYRPFDSRFIVYDKAVVTRPRSEVMPNLLGNRNIGLITTRQTRDAWDVFVTDRICGHKTCAAYDINYVFPLYLYPADGSLLGDEAGSGPGGRRPNSARP